MDYEQIKVKRKEWVLEQLDLSREMADGAEPAKKARS